MLAVFMIEMMGLGSMVVATALLPTKVPLLLSEAPEVEMRPVPLEDGGGVVPVPEGGGVVVPDPEGGGVVVGLPPEGGGGPPPPPPPPDGGGGGGVGGGGGGGGAPTTSVVSIGLSRSS